MKTKYSIEEWDETHPRWQEFVACLELVAPEQAPFVFEEYYRAYQSVLLVALQSNEVVGFIRFAVGAIPLHSMILTLPTWIIRAMAL